MGTPVSGVLFGRGGRVERMPLSVDSRERPEPRARGILGAAVAAALLFAASIPARYLFPLSVFAPFPLILLHLRSGAASALAGALAATALLATTVSLLPALVFLFLLALPGLLIGEAMSRGRGLRRGCLRAFALVAAQILAVLLFAGPSMESLALEPLNQLRSPDFVTQMKASLPAHQVDRWVEQVTRSANVMAVIYPGAYVILGALMVLANAWLLRAYLARRDPGWLEGGEFETLRWGLGLVALFVVAGAVVAAPPLRPAAYNVLLVVAFFFALQGLAVVAFYVHRLAGPGLLRVGLVLLVLLNPWAPRILPLLGLFDTWLDFRRLAQAPPRGASG